MEATRRLDPERFGGAPAARSGAFPARGARRRLDTETVGALAGTDKIVATRR
jgi:hypothetical protein